MLPAVALVGRPNVGKSTLFNRLTGARDALVANFPGLTRDRKYGRALIGERPVMLIDTGGLLGDDDSPVNSLMQEQVSQALTESDLVLFLVDAQDGLLPDDERIARDLRRRGLPLLLVINKIDGRVPEQVAAEFAKLGFPIQVQITATHGRGLASLSQALEETLPRVPDVPLDEVTQDSSDAIRVAIIGRPNVGKSTLVNRLVGEERQVVFDEPGTTRDSVEVPFSRDAHDYLLIDTAGVRRRGKVNDMVEKFSVVKTLQALSSAQVAVLVIDASEGLVDQDLHLLSFAMDAGTGLIVAVNKWDGLDGERKRQTKALLERKLAFAPWLPQRTISALHGTGVGHLLEDVRKVHKAGAFDVATSVLTQILIEAVAQHQPPAPRGRMIKLRFAHPAGSHPPTIRIHGNQTQELPASYVRYLENVYRDTLKLIGTPVKIEFARSSNPYAGRKNELTPRQEKRREKMIKSSREARTRRQRKR